jgi:hypothetical protein
VPQGLYSDTTRGLMKELVQFMRQKRQGTDTDELSDMLVNLVDISAGEDDTKYREALAKGRPLTQDEIKQLGINGDPFLEQEQLKKLIGRGILREETQPVDHELSRAELIRLGSLTGDEFALVYSPGTGKDGSGGSYFVTRGNLLNVGPPPFNPYKDIRHNHVYDQPPSPADRAMLNYADNQDESEVVVPVPGGFKVYPYSRSGSSKSASDSTPPQSG